MPSESQDIRTEIDSKALDMGIVAAPSILPIPGETSDEFKARALECLKATQNIANEHYHAALDRGDI